MKAETLRFRQKMKIQTLFEKSKDLIMLKAASITKLKRRVHKLAGRTMEY